MENQETDTRNETPYGKTGLFKSESAITTKSMTMAIDSKKCIAITLSPRKADVKKK